MVFHEVGSGEGPVVLLLGPELCGWWSMAALSARLTDDFRVILATWDGYGEAAATPFPGIEGEAREVVDWVRRHFPEGICAVVGVAMGGQVALEACLAHRNLARGIVLGDVLCEPTPGPSLSARLTAITWRLMGGGSGDDGRPVRRAGYIRSQMGSMGIPAVLMDRFVEGVRATPPTCAHDQELARSLWRLPRDASRLSIPAIVTVAGIASAPYRTSAEELCRALGCKLRLIAGTGRNELYLADPGRAMDLIGPYLRTWADEQGGGPTHG